MRKEKSAATLTIFKADEMSWEGRRAVARWLQRQAKMLQKEGKNYSNRFTGRYLYR